MIPLKLSVRNFMCYGDNVAPLFFDGFRLACLSGDNGHGKSALLDAITWALWGQARAKTDDELIHLGRAEMEVEFEFLLADNRYRVLRKRSRPRSERGAGHTELHLFVTQDGETYRPLTGNSVRETERKIVEILRMQYDTFINSAFLLQGRADEFTVKPPAERKRVLAEILGLTYYDELEKRARERAREREAEHRTLALSIADLDRQLEKKSEYEQEWQVIESALQELEGQARLLETELSLARERKKALDGRSEMLRDVEERLGSHRQELERAESQVVEHEAVIASYERALAASDEVETGWQRLLAARRAHEDLNLRLSQLLELSSRRDRLEKVVEAVRAELVAQQREQQSAIRTLESKAAQVAADEAELERWSRELDGYRQVESRRLAAQERLHELAGEIAHLQSTNAALREEMARLKEKIALLGESDAACPLCRSELAPVARDRLRGEMEAEGRARGDQYRDHDARSKLLGQEQQSLRKEIATLDQALGAERARLQKRVGQLESRIAEGKAAATEASRHRHQLAETEGRLSAVDYAPAERQSLREVLTQIQALGYDAGRHEAIRAELVAFAPFDDRHCLLQQAERSLVPEQAARTRAAETAARWRERVEADARRRDDLAREVAELPRLVREASAAQQAFDSATEKLARARERYGAIRQLLDHCSFLENTRKEKRVALRQAADERAIYEELAVAFGKKGIQAMIIETALPEIEEEANAILSRMTDNRMHVRFETQRDTRRGDTIETLDIKIADELGTRNYELYSGGEAFRVNFAIRIALSKVLARRAGARLQTLVIDEGFGTQDAGGREKLVDAINSIQDDFEKILVITHIQELKDLFPVRIEVAKTPEGSQINLAG